jgi:hypothetical protein
MCGSAWLVVGGLARRGFSASGPNEVVCGMDASFGAVRGGCSQTRLCAILARASAWSSGGVAVRMVTETTTKASPLVK